MVNNPSQMAVEQAQAGALAAGLEVMDSVENGGAIPSECAWWILEMSARENDRWALIYMERIKSGRLMKSEEVDAQRYRHFFLNRAMALRAAQEGL
jgi:hypothetical protein